MAEPQHFLGFDIGTTQVKGGLFDARGRVLASFSRPYPTARPRPGIVEQDPDDWLRALRDGLTRLTAAAEGRAIAALGLCSQVNTDVFVDAQGRPLLPAIMWQDSRASAEAAELAASFTAAEKRAWWGEGVEAPLGASHALAKMLWLARRHPDLWARCAWVLSPKDYCLLHLTGRAVADPVASWGQVGTDGRYLAAMLDRVPGAVTRLPPLVPMTGIVGETSIAGRAVPVVAGTMDAFGNLFGCGVCRSGQGMYMSGTSEILALAGHRHGAAGVVTFPEVEGLVVHAGPTQSGGDSLRWWGAITGVAPLQVPELAAQADRTGRPLLFLPQLEGERAPLWDSALRGAFLGLDSRTGPPDLAMALLEGVALSARLLFQALTAAAGLVPEVLLYGGGGAQSDLWSQIRADCLGVPLQRLAHPDVGSLGAAILGAVGVGRFTSIAAAAPAMAVTQRVFAPDPAMRPRYDRLFTAYRAATEALRPITATLAAA